MTATANSTRFKALTSSLDKNVYAKLGENLTFAEFFDRVYANPLLARSAYQRLYDMIHSFGIEDIIIDKKKLWKYKFYENNNIFGIENTLYTLTNLIRAGAEGMGPERRLVVLLGPVGSCKSSLLKSWKVGLENYTKRDEGALYSYTWVKLPKEVDHRSEVPCPTNDNPLKLIPEERRKAVSDDLTKISRQMYEAKRDILVKAGNKAELEHLRNPYKVSIVGNLSPVCRLIYNKLMDLHGGDWEKVINEHVKIRRVVFSEAGRIGIGTFQPKDEKNQDAADLTGDVNYRNITVYGSDSDPRAFNYDGELQVANGGICEFIEVFKLNYQFLYDILGATQERQIKPKKGSQMDIDCVLIGHTNIPEFDRLRNDNKMEALRDRVIIVETPYVLELSNEMRILKRDYNPNTVDIHIAPHTLEVAAMFSVISRLSVENDKDGLNKITKAKLYDRQPVQGHNQESVIELRRTSAKYKEGIQKGISPRQNQNILADCFMQSAKRNKKYINPFIYLGVLTEHIKNDKKINDEKIREELLTDSQAVKDELDDILKNEVQKAIVADDGSIQELHANYIDNVVAYLNNKKVNDPITGEDGPPNEKLMRQIEEMIDIPERQSPEFRNSIARAYMGAQSLGKKFEFDTDVQLLKAYQKYMFESCKDVIKLSDVSGIGIKVNKDQQAKLEIVKQRLIDEHGYIPETADDVIRYVGTLFSRGTTKS